MFQKNCLVEIKHGHAKFPKISSAASRKFSLWLNIIELGLELGLELELELQLGLELRLVHNIDADMHSAECQHQRHLLDAGSIL